MKAQTIQPTLWVLESVQHVGPREALIVSGVAVGSQSGADETTLLVRDELSSVGVVLNEPIRGDSDDDGSNTLLVIELVSWKCQVKLSTNQNENPSPTIGPHDAFHVSNALTIVSKLIEW